MILVDGLASDEEDGSVDDVGVRDADLDRVLGVGYVCDGKGDGFVCEDDVARVLEGDLEREVAARLLILQLHVPPLDNEVSVIVDVLDAGVVADGRVKVGHERRDVLRRRQPRVDRLSQVQEAAGRDRHIADRVTVERERELQLNRRCSTVRVGQHLV